MKNRAQIKFIFHKKKKIEVRNVNGSDSLLAMFNLANYQNFIYKYQEIFLLFIKFQKKTFFFFISHISDRTDEIGF